MSVARRLGRLASLGAGVYAAAAFGVVGSIVAARVLGPRDFGLFALALATVAFVQGLLDLTVEEATITFGVGFAGREEWARLRRLFAVALRLRLVGALLAAAIVAALSLGAERVFDAEGIALPMLVAALIPVVQVADTMSAAVVVRRRYDIRGGLLALAAGLRLAGIAAGVRFGVTGAIAGALAGQALGTAVTALVGRAALARYPSAPAEGLGPARAGELRRFVVQASIGSSLVAARTWLAPLVVGAVAGPVQAGFLRAAQTSDQALASLSAPARLVILGEHADAWERGDRAAVLRGIRRYMSVAGCLMLLSIPPAIIFTDELVRLVFGDPFDPAADAVRIALGAAALQFVFGWSKPFAASIRRPGIRTAIAAVEVAVLVCLVLLFAREHGAAGGAAALLASSAVACAAWTGVLLRLRRSVAGAGPALTP